MVRPDERVVLHYGSQRRLLGGHRARLVDVEPEPEPPPPRRQWVPWPVVGSIGAAVVLGFLAGYAPATIGPALLALAVLAAMVLRLELAVLVLVATSVFEDYLAVAQPAAVKAIGLLLVVAWAVRRCRGRLHTGRRSPVLEATFAFSIALMLATVVHNNGAAGLEVVLRYAGFLVVLVVLADVLRAGLAVATVARVYVAACAVAAVCGLLSYGAGLDRRVGGPIGDPNDFAFFLLPAVALGLAARTTATRRLPWDLATVLIVLAVLGTLSRGALLGLVAMAVLAVGARMVRVRTAFALAVVVGAAAVVVAVVAPGLVSTSIEQKGVVADQNVSERLELWSAAGRMTLEHPILGMGPGAFALRHEDYTSGLPDDIAHPLDVAHNTWLEVSSELGVLGLAGFVAILVAAFGTAWSAWRRRGDPYAAAVSVSLVGACVAASFVTEQYYLPLWLLCALAVGLGEDRP